MHIKPSRRCIKSALTLISFFSMMGCGGDRVTAPFGSEISVNPDSITYSFNPAALVCDHPDSFTITAISPEGVPMNNVELYIDYPWAVGHGYSWVQFYVDGTAVNVPVKVLTDHSGNAQISLTINRCTQTFTGDMSIRSSTAYTTATIAVN